MNYAKIKMLRREKITNATKWVIRIAVVVAVVISMVSDKM
jgi:hypothetical protein